MDERITILDAKGRPTGATAMKSEAHRFGLFHATVHVWFFNTNGDILLQLRGRNKDVFPLLWDVSVAGHICAGEEVEAAAVREIKEEIGLHIKPNALEKVGVFSSKHQHSQQLIDNEFLHTFVGKLRVPVHQLTKQASEVEDVKLMPLLAFEKAVAKNHQTKLYVPHASAYYDAIITAIKTRL